MAYHSPSDFFVRSVKVKAKRGCVYISVKELEDRWRWSRGKVERFLKYLEEDERIKIKASNVVNSITILNYEKFQGSDECTNNLPNEPLYKNDNTLFANSLISDTEDNALQQILKQIQELKDRIDIQDKQIEKRPKKKESNPLISKGKLVFEKKYAELYSSSYYWQAKDAVAMDSLTKKITFSRQQKGMSIAEEDVLNALSAFLSNVQDEWILKNFSVTNINSKYNEIVAQARANFSNGKQNKSNNGDRRRSSEVTATKAEDYEGTF